MKRLVLLGGGHAHVEVLRSLAENPGARPEVTVVTPFPRLIYTGMVPGVIAGHYRLDECAIAIDELAQRAGAGFVQSRVSLVNPRARDVMCADGGVIAYDVLSIDVGSHPVIGAASGVEKHAVAVRPLEDLMKGWGIVLARARAGTVGSITVVGGGAGGVELALAMDHRLRAELGDAKPHVRIITNTPVPVPEFCESARWRLRRHLAKCNIGVHISSTVAEVGHDHVRLDTGLEFASDATFWAAGAGAQPWVRESGFATDERGFLLTNEFLQSVTYRDVFGAGDCATQEGRPLAKAGVFAVRAAPVLAANLRAALGGGELAPFRTNPRFLALVSVGARHAIGTWNGFAWEGDWAWHWKDRIDRAFVAKYSSPAS
jgi:pyridine nucleotide-disulfide oxidoreductase family protein